MTEERRKEWLRIRREKETEDHKNQHFTIIKSTVAGWWKWVGEKIKTGDGYQTAQETDEERRVNLEKMVATELFKLAMETKKEKQDWRRW